MGLPLNTLITINFRHTAIQPECATQAFARWRTKHFGKWAGRPRKGSGPAFRPTFAYWFENKRDSEVYEEIGPCMPHNVHVQMYAHVPAQRLFDLRGKAYEWLDYISGEISAEDAVKIDRVSNDNGVMKYGRKGACLAGARRYGSEDIMSPQGLIIGKRTGTSTNIGVTARRKTDRQLGIVRKLPRFR